jgi:hypothetical protein
VAREACQKLQKYLPHCLSANCITAHGVILQSASLSGYASNAAGFIASPTQLPAARTQCYAAIAATQPPLISCGLTESLRCLARDVINTLVRQLSGISLATVFELMHAMYAQSYALYQEWALGMRSDFARSQCSTAYPASRPAPRTHLPARHTQRAQAAPRGISRKCR